MKGNCHLPKKYLMHRRILEQRMDMGKEVCGGQAIGILFTCDFCRRSSSRSDVSRCVFRRNPGFESIKPGVLMSESRALRFIFCKSSSSFGRCIP